MHKLHFTLVNHTYAVSSINVCANTKHSCNVVFDHVFVKQPLIFKHMDELASSVCAPACLANMIASVVVV